MLIPSESWQQFIISLLFFARGKKDVLIKYLKNSLGIIDSVKTIGTVTLLLFPFSK